MYSNKVRFRPVLLVCLGLAGMVVPAGALDFSEVVARIGFVSSVELAEHQLAAARHDLVIAAYRGDVSAAITPSASATTSTAGFDGASVGVALSLTVPAGLSDDAEDRVTRAGETITAATRALEAARAAAFADLYRVYQDAWLAQEELDLLDAELDLARRAYEIAVARFDAGSITGSQLGAVREELERAQTARDQGTLTHRLAWLELAFAVGIDPSVPQDLAAEDRFTEDPPKPPELSAWALAHDPAIAAQNEVIASLAERADTEESILEFGSTRLQLSVFDHSASVSYSFANPTIAATYTPPELSFPLDGAPSRSVSPFSISLSGSITIGDRGEAELVSEATAIELDREVTRLEFLLDELDFRIRATYQQLHRATDAVAQAERTLSAVSESAGVIAARVDAGQSGEIDLLEAQVAVRRAEFALRTAWISREKAVMAAARAASYLTEHYPEAGSQAGA